LGLHHSHISGVDMAGGGFKVDQVSMLTWLDAALLDAAP
jgi:hypothetical protein